MAQPEPTTDRTPNPRENQVTVLLSEKAVAARDAIVRELRQVEPLARAQDAVEAALLAVEPARAVAAFVADDAPAAALADEAVES